MRVADALARARAAGLERLDAQVLLAHHLSRPRSWLLAHDDDEIDRLLSDAFDTDVARRAAGCPLAYLTGRREFHGLELAVGPAVLVPRPETEGLVDWALECIVDQDAPKVLDLGTGSGAIAIALAKRRPDAQVAASDVDPAALEVAAANARGLAARVCFSLSDWWRSWSPEPAFDLVVSNPPYVSEGDPHLAELCHEPRHALVAGADGLDAVRAIVAGAANRMLPGAWLLLEHGWDQGPAVRELLLAAGLAEVSTRSDLAGQQRCTGGRIPV